MIPIKIVWKRVGCVLGIEPNAHRIPRFHWKYGYLTNHSENTETPNSPNVPKCLSDVEFFILMNLSISQAKLGRTVRLR